MLGAGFAPFDAQLVGRHVDDVHFDGAGAAFAGGQQLLGIERGAAGHGFVGVHVHGGFQTGDRFDHARDHGHARGAADQQHVRQVFPGHAGLGDDRFGDSFRAGDQVAGGFFERVALHDEVGLGAVAFDMDASLLPRGERVLGLFGAGEQAANARHVVARIVAELFGELGGQILGQRAVPIASAQLRIASHGQRAQVAGLDLDDGCVELAATQIEHQHAAVGPGIWRQEALCLGEGQGRGQRVEDRTQHVQSGDARGVDHAAALGLVERRRHAEHDGRRTAEFFRQVDAQVLEQASLDHLGRQQLSADGARIGGLAEVALGAFGGALGLVGGRLVGGAAEQQLLVLEVDDAGNQQVALHAADHGAAPSGIEPRQGAVGGSQVDSNRTACGHEPTAWL